VAAATAVRSIPVTGGIRNAVAEHGGVARIEQALDSADHRVQQAVQARVGDVDLALEPLRDKNAQPTRPGQRGRVLQEYRLAGAGFAHEQQRTTDAAAQRIDELPDRAELVVAPHQPVVVCGQPRNGIHGGQRTGRWQVC
jgi:hypothetical protein